MRIAVHDNGPGVPIALQPNVFERFARGDDARNRAGAAPASACRSSPQSAKAHGGRVELEQPPGDTTFALLLPPRPDRPPTRGMYGRATNGVPHHGLKVGHRQRHSNRRRTLRHGHDDPHHTGRREHAARAPASRRTPCARTSQSPAARAGRPGRRSQRLWRGPTPTRSWARPALLGLLLVDARALHVEPHVRAATRTPSTPPRSRPAARAGRRSSSAAPTPRTRSPSTSRRPRCG